MLDLDPRRASAISSVIWGCAWCAIAVVALYSSVVLLAGLFPNGVDVVSMGTLEVLVLGGISLFGALQHQPGAADNGLSASLHFVGLGPARLWELSLGAVLGIAVKPAADALRWVIEMRWPTSGVELASRAEFLRHDTLGQLIALFLMVGLLGPIVEEMLYRGLAFRLLQRGLRGWLAVLVTSVFFATAHAAVRDWPSLFGVALVLGVARAASERIWACIGAHVAFNSCALLMVVIDYEVRLGVGLGHPAIIVAGLALSVLTLRVLRRMAR